MFHRDVQGRQSITAEGQAWIAETMVQLIGLITEFREARGLSERLLQPGDLAQRFCRQNPSVSCPSGQGISDEEVFGRVRVGARSLSLESPHSTCATGSCCAVEGSPMQGGLHIKAERSRNWSQS